MAYQMLVHVHLYHQEATRHSPLFHAKAGLSNGVACSNGTCPHKGTYKHEYVLSRGMHDIKFHGSAGHPTLVHGFILEDISREWLKSKQRMIMKKERESIRTKEIMTMDIGMISKTVIQDE